VWGTSKVDGTCVIWTILLTLSCWVRANGSRVSVFVCCLGTVRNNIQMSVDSLNIDPDHWEWMLSLKLITWGLNINL
jgi:hypothetical protein